MLRRTRREFIKAVGGTLGAPILARAAEPLGALPEALDRPTTTGVDASRKSIVAHLRSDLAIPDGKVHETFLLEMLEDSLLLATGKLHAGEAWNTLLERDDAIGLKFNHVGETVIGTTTGMARQLVKSLITTGDIAPERIMLIEVDARTRNVIETSLSEELGIKVKTKSPVFGFSGEEVDFGSGAERLSAVLQEVTGIINVPFLKTHNIATVTGCLKNLSHALIRRPVRYHDNGCAPYVGDILALPEIHGKLRLHVVNALRVVYDGGPDPATQNAVWSHGGLIVSTDPVAADFIGTDVINEERQKRKLAQLGDRLGQVPYIHAAAKRELGTDDQDYIELRDTPLG